MIRVTLEHLENGIVKSATTRSSDVWIDAILDVACANVSSEAIAALTVMRMVWEKLDECENIKDTLEIKTFVEKSLSFAEDTHVVWKQAETARERLAEMQTEEYWTE